jgi:uncharacterized spore protein YtfJ
MTTPTTTNPTNVTIPGSAPNEAGAAAEPQTGSFLARLANQIGTRASATTIVGTPIEREGVTVVPVARASWGFGGGSGSGGGEGQGNGEGSGGGGGANVRPVGYIEMKNGQASFRAIYDPNAVLRLAAALATAVALALALRLVGRVTRGR